MRSKYCYVCISPVGLDERLRGAACFALRHTILCYLPTMLGCRTEIARKWRSTNLPGRRRVHGIGILRRLFPIQSFRHVPTYLYHILKPPFWASIVNLETPWCCRAVFAVYYQQHARSRWFLSPVDVQSPSAMFAHHTMTLRKVLEQFWQGPGLHAVLSPMTLEPCVHPCLH